LKWTVAMRNLVGTWQLLYAFMEDAETKVQTRAWGEHPNGWLILTEA